MVFACFFHLYQIISLSLTHPYFCLVTFNIFFHVCFLIQSHSLPLFFCCSVSVSLNFSDQFFISNSFFLSFFLSHFNLFSMSSFFEPIFFRLTLSLNSFLTLLSLFFYVENICGEWTKSYRREILMS